MRTTALFAAALLGLSIVGCAARPGMPQAPDGKAPRVLVVTAVDYEQSAVRSLLQSPTDGMLGGRAYSVGQVGDVSVIAIRAGWGKAHAAGATALAIERFHPSLVVMAGISGGLDPQRATSGDVVVGEATFQHDLGLRGPGGDFAPWPPQTPLEKPYPAPRFESPPKLVAAAALGASETVFSPWMLPKGCTCQSDGRREPSCTGEERQVDRPAPRVLVGILATGDVFLADPSLAKALAARDGALSVDMETAAVAQEAADHGLPFLGVRVIADMVGGPEGESLYYCLKPQSGPRLAAVLARILPAVARVR
jgi:adenosylhomocysteine nucleosidase